MTPRTESDSQSRQLRPGAVVLLVLTVALGVLVVTVSYGLAREYGDTAASDARIAAQSLRDWGIGVLLVVGFGGAAFAAARRFAQSGTSSYGSAPPVPTTNWRRPSGTGVPRASNGANRS